MSTLDAGVVIPAATLTTVHALLPAEQVIEGTPTTATVELGTYRKTEIGVWEMSPGTVTDVESDEVFVVLSGRAQITFTDRDLEPIEVSYGDVVRLEAGMQTTWKVTETLRKVYVT